MRIRAIMVTVAFALAVPTVQAHADTEYRYQGEWAKTDHCPTEEADGIPADVVPCIWDARHQGNGEGDSLSYRHRRDGTLTVRVIGHRKAHCRTHWHLTAGCR